MILFTVEEQVLLNSFNYESRSAAIADLRHALDASEDPELRDSCRRLLKKLSVIRDQDFSAIDFSAYS